MSLQRALGFVNEAVEADRLGAYEAAAPYYAKAVSELELCLRLEENEATRRMIGGKIEEYHLRLRQIAPEAGIPVPSSLAVGRPPSPVAAAAASPTAMMQSAMVMPCTTSEETRMRAELGLRAPAALSGSEAWQTAIDVVERGKSEDTARNFARALALYQCAMAYFLRAIHSEDVLTLDMKAKAREQMKAFLTRAEQLKAFLASTGEGGGGAAAVAAVEPVEQAATGNCAACGKPMQSSIFALEREWHPACFVDKVHCAFCDQPFSLLDLRFVVNKDNGLPYHVRCFDFTTGLSKSIEKTFLGHSGKMFLKVNLQKRLFHLGEAIEMEFIFDNETSVKLNSVQIMLVAEEGRSSRNEKYERVEVVTKKPVAKTDTQFGHTLPMAIGRFSETLSFQLPPDVQPTVVNDQAMRREYFLHIKAIPSGVWSSFEMEFPVTIQE